MRRTITLALAGLLSGCGTAPPTVPPENLACNLAQFMVPNDGLTLRLTAAHGKLEQHLQPLAPSNTETGAVKTDNDTVAAALKADVDNAGAAFSADKRQRSPSTPHPQNQALNELNILELSAGGEYGAYGSGFLYGWSQNGAAASPVARANIQVVTGVSTGAMMATYAFLQTLPNPQQNYDKVLADSYSTLTDAQIYSSRSMVSLIWADSLYETSAKKALIENGLSEAVLDAVAAAPDDRQLYIGLVNIDSGAFERIDMVALARSKKPQRTDCYRAVVDAASAVEVAFPPRFIDGHMWGDGGARRHLFLASPDYLDPTAASTIRHFRSIAIVHGALNVDEQQTRDGVLQIAQQAESIGLDQLLKDSAAFLNVIATAPEALVGPAAASKMPRYETFYAAAQAAACQCKHDHPECGPGTPGGDEIFCTPYEKCLAERGVADGKAYTSPAGKWLQIGDLNLGSGQACTPSNAPSNLPQARPKYKPRPNFK